jgi:hypothetical protein
MTLAAELQADVEAVKSIDSVDMALRVLIQATKMRIALIARVTPDSWTACAVRDDAGFGIKPGDQLDLSSTY